MNYISSTSNASEVSRRRGVRLAAPDEDLSRLGAMFSDLDAALRAGDMSPRLRDQWWTVVNNALPIRAKAARGRRIKAIMLLAVIRQTGVDGPVPEMARSVALDLTGRPGRKRKPSSSTGLKIRYFVEKGLSRRAAKALTALGCEELDDVLSLNARDLCAGRNCGRVTSAELLALMQERRRLQVGLAQ
jgi:hypothetical protein